RLATGLPPASPGLQTFAIPLHVLQDDRQDDDLPFGSRGGIAVHYQFPVDGEYVIKVRLRRQYQDYLMGMGWPQQLDVRLDGKLLKRFTVGGGATGRPAAARYARDGEPACAGGGGGGGRPGGGSLGGGGGAGLRRRSRVGNLHADRRRRRPRASHSDPCRHTDRRGLLRARAVGAGRAR